MMMAGYVRIFDNYFNFFATLKPLLVTGGDRSHTHLLLQGLLGRLKLLDLVLMLAVYALS